MVHRAQGLPFHVEAGDDLLGIHAWLDVFQRHFAADWLVTIRSLLVRGPRGLENAVEFQAFAGCHSTGADADTGKWVELNLACESCHGPGKPQSDKPKLANIVNPARLSVERSMDVCLSCHQSGKPEETDYAWAVGYELGLELSKYWHGFEPEAGRQTAEFWKNGAAHKNRIQGNTFLQSVMAHSGLQCSNCHESHGFSHGFDPLRKTSALVRVFGRASDRQKVRLNCVRRWVYIQ
jgi:hypothetical protein